MGRRIENFELTHGLTGKPPESDDTPAQHPLVRECDYIAKLGQQIMRGGDCCGITFPSGRRSTRGLRRERQP